MKKIAVWSLLRYCNFGDDLQAVLFSLHLKSLGYDPIVYQLDLKIAALYNLKVASNYEELFDGVDVCVMAGGGLLTPYSFLKRVLKKEIREFENDFKKINDYSSKGNLTFICISIGGDGFTHYPFFKAYSRDRALFFESNNLLKSGSVRLNGDVHQMDLFNKKYIYFPDCLLQTPFFLDIQPKPKQNKIRVGINLKKNRGIPNILIRSIYDYAQNNDDIEFVFFKTHMNYVDINYEYLPECSSRNINIFEYESLDTILSELKSLDCVISSKLHLGLVSMSLGTMFLSYKGPQKAKKFLESIGANEFVLNDDSEFLSIKNKFLSEGGLLARYSSFFELEKISSESIGHFQLLGEILEQLDK